MSVCEMVQKIRSYGDKNDSRRIKESTSINNNIQSRATPTQHRRSSTDGIREIRGPCRTPEKCPWLKLESMLGLRLLLLQPVPTLITECASGTLGQRPLARLTAAGNLKMGSSEPREVYDANKSVPSLERVAV